MRGAQITGIVTRQSEIENMPDLTVKTTRGEIWIVTTMKAKGSIGVTTRDFLGADLRHYIRSLKNKGIGIEDEWETDTFGKHKRWKLKSGHHIELVPIPPKKKTPTAATEGLSDSNSNRTVSEVLNEASI